MLNESQIRGLLNKAERSTYFLNHLEMDNKLVDIQFPGFQPRGVLLLNKTKNTIRGDIKIQLS